MRRNKVLFVLSEDNNELNTLKKNNNGFGFMFQIAALKTIFLHSSAL